VVRGPAGDAADDGQGRDRGVAEGAALGRRRPRPRVEGGRGRRLGGGGPDGVDEADEGADPLPWPPRLRCRGANRASGGPRQRRRDVGPRVRLATPTLGSRRPSGGRPGVSPGRGERSTRSHGRAPLRLGSGRRLHGSGGRADLAGETGRPRALAGTALDAARGRSGSGPRRRTGRGAARLAPPSEGGEPAALGGTPLAPPPSLPGSPRRVAARASAALGVASTVVPLQPGEPKPPNAGSLRPKLPALQCREFRRNNPARGCLRPCARVVPAAKPWLPPRSPQWRGGPGRPARLATGPAPRPQAEEAAVARARPVAAGAGGPSPAGERGCRRSGGPPREVRAGKAGDRAAKADRRSMGDRPREAGRLRRSRARTVAGHSRGEETADGLSIVAQYCALRSLAVEGRAASRKATIRPT